MRKFSKNKGSFLGLSLSGSATVLLSIVTFIVAMWVLITVTRVAIG